MGHLKGRSLREIAETEAKRRAEPNPSREEIRADIRRDRYISAYRQGMSIKSIADYYKVSANVVADAVRGFKRGMKDVRDALIVTKFEDGMCSKCIAFEHNISYATVQRKTRGKHRKQSIVCYRSHDSKTLTSSDRLELERVSSLRHSVLRLLEDGKSVDDVARALDISRASVVEYSE